ncbi:MAG: type II secretion system protein [Bacilli bacterium]|nr:type II secretion system protein [Bacilli bacterium]
MKKNGFTLIELVGTIVILSLALIIVVPTVTKNVRNGMIDADTNAKSSIELAAKNWATDNMGTVGESYCVKVLDLQNQGYLDKNLKMPSNGNANINNAGVRIGIKAGTDKKTYTYKYVESC